MRQSWLFRALRGVTRTRERLEPSVQLSRSQEWWLERTLGLQIEYDPVTLRVVSARGGEGLFGISSHDLMGRDLSDFWPEDFRDKQRARLRGTGETAPAGCFDIQILEPHGDVHIAEAFLAPAGGATRWIALRDVTLERAREREIEERSLAMEFTNQYITDLNRDLESSGRELEAAKERLSELNESKSRFLAMAAHELRTPMTAAKTAVSVLQAGMLGPVSEKQGEVLAMIHQNVDRLVRLVNELLDLARIEAGKVELRFQEFEVNALLTQVAGLMRAEAEHAGIRIEVEAAPLAWVADPDRVQQIVLNLLGNAVKFTPAGGVTTLAARPVPEGLLLEIRDSGDGISPEDLPLLFRPFERLDNESTRKAVGTGLGLSISRELVELHGGRIWPESQVGQGTSIFFTLPQRAIANQAA